MHSVGDADGLAKQVVDRNVMHIGHVFLCFSMMILYLLCNNFGLYKWMVEISCT